MRGLFISVLTLICSQRLNCSAVDVQEKSTPPPPPVMCIFPTDVCTRASSCLFMRRRATLDKFTAICPEWMAAINEAGSTSFGQITLQAVMALPIALLHSSEPCNHHNSSIDEASIQCSSSQIDSLACSSPIHPSLSVTGPT